VSNALAIFVGAMILAAACLFIDSIIVMFAWNFVASVFWLGAPHISVLQAFAVTLLISRIGARSTSIAGKGSE
jgi:hypothetical protein